MTATVVTADAPGRVGEALAEPAGTAMREVFYGRIAERNLSPLWRMLKGLVPSEPSSPAVPARWSYADVRPDLLEACALIGAEEAERRVLMLENPAMPGQAKITGSLYAGLQIIMPGEVAAPHRHAASALRFVIEGRAGWTSVDNERTWMEPGDFVVTPSWTWHEHGNEGDGPVVWLDGLDIHIVNLLDCGFRQDTHQRPSLPERPTGASWHAYGAGLLPLDADRGRLSSPLFNYPYARSREALDGMARSRAIDPHRGHILRYANPLNGDWAIPTIATWLQLLPRGFESRPLRSTDGAILVVVEGEGHSIIGGRRFDWRPRDVIAAPAWIEASHHPRGDAVLFGASDRAAQEKLGLWRERAA